MLIVVRFTKLSKAMMTAFFLFLLSQSILIPILIGLIHIKRMGKIYYPFFALLVIGFINELISFIFIHGFQLENSVTSNIYSLIECCLILYQLYVWQNSKKGYWLFVILASTCVVVWIIENVFFFKINTFDSPYFMVLYSFVIVMLSINQINEIITHSKLPLLKNPQIILCVAFVTYFIYQIIYRASEFISVESILYLRLNIGFAYINFIINLLFAVAVFFITSKNKDKYDEYFRNR